MATNTNLVNMKNLFNNFYRNFIIDNKFILNYLEDITNGSLSDNNNFNKTIQKLLLCNINDNNLLTINKSAEPITAKNNFIKILDVIIDIFELYISALSQNGFNYNKISIIILKSGASNLLSYTPGSNTMTIQSMNLINLNNNWNGSSNDGVTYNKEDTEYIVAIGGDLSNIDYNKIIINNIFFLLNSKDYNIKLQANALHSYYKLIKLYYRFYNESEKMLYTTNTTTICNNISTIISDLNDTSNNYIQVEEFTNYNIEKFEISNNCIINETEGNVELTVTSCLPFIVSVPSNSFKINCDDFSPNNFKLTIYDSNGSPFDLEIVSCISVPPNNIKDSYITEITTNACCNINIGSSGTCPVSANSDSSSTNQLNIPSSFVNGNKCSSSIRKKTLTDLKKEFIIGGKKLKKKNDNIENYRKKINNTINRFNINKNKNDIVSIQLNIYYCIFGIITFLLIGLSLYNIENKNKQFSVLGIISFIIILIVINYFIQKKYIEEFKEKFTQPDCSNLVSTSDKINYIQKMLNIFIPDTEKCLNNIMAYLPTLDTVDLYKNLTNSIRKEQKTFKGIEDLFYHKDINSLEYTQILKHEILNKSSLISLISSLYLIISLIYLGYIMYPEYIKIFLFIGLLLFIPIIALYFISLKEIVRKNSSNKYWSKPSNTIITNLS